MKQTKSNFKFLMVILFLSLWANLQSTYAQDYQNTITFDNQSGEFAVVKLMGPTDQIIDVPNSKSHTVNVDAGEYYILVRYGTKPASYTYSKGEPFTVTQTETEYSELTITLHKVIGGNYSAKPISNKEFDKATVTTQSTEQIKEESKPQPSRKEGAEQVAQKSSLIDDINKISNDANIKSLFDNLNVASVNIGNYTVSNKAKTITVYDIVDGKKTVIYTVDIIDSKKPSIMLFSNSEWKTGEKIKQKNNVEVDPEQLKANFDKISVILPTGTQTIYVKTEETKTFEQKEAEQTAQKALPKYTSAVKVEDVKVTESQIIIKTDKGTITENRNIVDSSIRTSYTDEKNRVFTTVNKVDGQQGVYDFYYKDPKNENQIIISRIGVKGKISEKTIGK